MIYLLEYMNALYLKPGYFQSEQDALGWIYESDPKHRVHYRVIGIPANGGEYLLDLPSGTPRMYRGIVR